MNSDTVQKIMDMAIAYAPKVLMALLTLIIGFWIISKIIGYLKRVMKHRGMDDTLSNFLASLASIAMKVMLLLSVAGQFGVDTTSFLAILAALMVGIGMALNGSIGHLASGVMLMIFKPFKVEDIVTIGGGETGKVEAINAFNTTLATLDNKRIIIANSNVTGNTITNISGQGTVGVELTFGIDYNASIDEARAIILGVGKDCPHVLNDPAQGVVVAELGDNSVNLATRPFCNSEHYWDVYFYMNEHVKKQLDKAGIGIPYPQVDVHMIQN
ncbi:MAG: mechanosensitive ion channel family protein [Saprospiraceae bacterium]|nr:mechanosensitive ion channel family protein [Saprospiraceae bacterium]